MPAQGPTIGFVPGSEVSLLRRICNNTAIIAEAAGGGGIPVWVTPPVSSSAAGVAGQMAYDADYFYVCVATNTWRRVALNDWA